MADFRGTYRLKHFGKISNVSWQECMVTGGTREKRCITVFWEDMKKDARSMTIPMRFGYPGNDPENGPADWLVSDDLTPAQNEMLTLLRDESFRVLGC